MNKHLDCMMQQVLSKTRETYEYIKQRSLSLKPHCSQQYYHDNQGGSLHPPTTETFRESSQRRQRSQTYKREHNTWLENTFWRSN